MPTKNTAVSGCTHGGRREEGLTERREDTVGSLDATDTDGQQAGHHERHREGDEANGDGVAELAVLDGDGRLREVDWVAAGRDHTLDMGGPIPLLEVAGTSVSRGDVGGGVGRVGVGGGGHDCLFLEVRVGEATGSKWGMRGLALNRPSSYTSCRGQECAPNSMRTGAVNSLTSRKDATPANSSASS